MLSVEIQKCGPTLFLVIGMEKEVEKVMKVNYNTTYKIYASLN